MTAQRDLYLAERDSDRALWEKQAKLAGEWEAKAINAQTEARRLREALADAAVDSKQFTLDVAALQNYKSRTNDAWDYWHGGIAYARRVALSATVAAGKAEKT